MGDKVRGASKKDKAAKLGLLAHDVVQDTADVDLLADQIESDELRLRQLQAINGSDKLDESLVRDCYRELGQRFVEPVTQGLAGLGSLLTEESPTVEYEISAWKGARVESVTLRDPGKLSAAFNAIYGAQAVGSAEFATQFGVAKADMEAFFGIKGGATASVDYNWGGLVAEVGAKLFAGAEFQCSGELVVGSATDNVALKLNGRAFVGVDLNAGASLQITPLQAKAALELSAFAGAKVTAEGKFSGTIFGRQIFENKLTATASAGIGADFSAEVAVGVESIGFGFDAGVTVGVGGSVGATTTINTTNVAMTLTEAKDRISHAYTYSLGYRNLSLQEAEWEMKIEKLKKAYRKRIDEAESTITRKETNINN